MRTEQPALMRGFLGGCILLFGRESVSSVNQMIILIEEHQVIEPNRPFSRLPKLAAALVKRQSWFDPQLSRLLLLALVERFKLNPVSVNYTPAMYCAIQQ